PVWLISDCGTTGSLSLRATRATAQAGKRTPHGQPDPRQPPFRRRRLRSLRKVEPHGRDAAPGDAVDDKLDRPERKAVADLRLMVQMGGKPVRERHCRAVGRDGETVNFTKRAKRDVTRNEEITEQAHIGGGRRWHVDEKSVKCSRFLRRGQKIRIVALPNSVGLSRSENMPVAYHQR